MSIDDCLHSIFGVSKVAADVMVQEYGRYFGMKTACFRGGTLTGPAHSAAELHGFLAYVMRCVMEGRTYKLFGYKGKMVRDAIHSHDVLTAFEAFFRAPRSGRGLQPRRRPVLQHLAHRGVRLAAGDHRAGRRRSTTWSSTGSATTSGGSATWPASRRTTPTGSRRTTCRRSCARSTRPTSTSGCRRRDRPAASATSSASWSTPSTTTPRPSAIIDAAPRAPAARRDRARRARGDDRGARPGAQRPAQRFDLVTPDGQPVRWALNLLHGAGARRPGLRARRSPCGCWRGAPREGLPVYLYGSTEADPDPPGPGAGARCSRR